MTLDEFTWEAHPPSGDDQVLIEAYQRQGVPVDALAYTDAFERLVSDIGLNAKDPDDLRTTYRRLLSLRKRRLLPRTYAGTAASDDE